MKIAELIRLETGEHGTFGVLLIDKKILCWTLEPPDKANKVNVSCIPSGQYIVEPRRSGSFGDVYEVKNVQDRTYIYFHKGNYVSDTKGCILLGTEMSTLTPARAVYDSGTAYDILQDIIGKEPFHLTIRWGI